ncbi:MAG: VWA domain-containing protein [Jatrophihabitantaceae bacterium]
MLVIVATLALVGGDFLHRGTPAKSAAVLTSPNCKGSGNLTLVIDVAPPLAVPVTQIVQTWSQTNPKAAGKCIQVELDSDTVDQQELRLAGQSGASTSVWLPDSTVWPQRLIADQAVSAGTSGKLATKTTVNVHPSIAESPLVAVTSPDRAAKLSAQVGQPGFDPLASAAIVSPIQDAEGLLSLLGINAQLSPSRTTNASLVAKFQQLSPTTLNLQSDGFDQLASSPDRAASFIASEQSVFAANADRGSVIAAAVYPIKPTFSLDFPVVRLNHPGDDPALTSAADQFEQQLRLPASKTRFNAAGLRAPDGSPIPKAGAGQGVMPDLVTSPAEPTSAQTLTVLRLWKAALADSNTLAVIDVSGSMADSAGNGQSKIAVAAGAARSAVSYFPKSSALGLWVFSSDQSASTPWAQLVPLGLLADQVGNVSRRQALLSAAASMPARVHGGTALYNTVLAAYQQVQRSFDASKVNSVVLMTDGQNDYQPGLTLGGLLTALHQAADPSKPVQVITIGIGPDVDSSALGQISSTTGGRYYQVKSAADISGVFLDAVAQRR